MPWLWLTIFVTGAAILALELLASRIMTPYFGVSLYIWSGILSITLIALAVGYGAGGWLARRWAPERRDLAFLWLPPIAGIALGLAALAYPWLFPRLAALDLVAGAYLAGMVLLLVPLAATSAMNPLLVAITPVAGADHGAGRVFFVSTLGSVAGVPVAAFGLIPHVTNHLSLLAVGAALSAMPLPRLALRKPSSRGGLVLAAFGIVLCLGLALTADWRLDRGVLVPRQGALWQIEREYGSLYGSVKIIALRRGGEQSRIYFQDGIMQNRVDTDGASLSLFTYALEALALAYAPQAKSALVLGLGAGIVPMRLAEHGLAVEVVEINPASWAAAREYFGFDPGRVVGHLADARSFVRRCRAAHDIAIVDLFQGDGVPDYLVTREFFADLAHCLRPGGVMVMNSFIDLDRPQGHRHIVASIAAAFPEVLTFRRPGYEGVANSFLVASGRALPEHLPAFDAYRGELRLVLANPSRADAAALRGIRPISDELNFLGQVNAESYMDYRRQILDVLPESFLVN